MMQFIRHRKILVGLVAVLLAVTLFIHLVLPNLILRKINDHLATFSPVYAVHITSLELSLLRMAYRFNAAEVKYKKDGYTFATVESVDVAIAWRELFRGRVLTDIEIDGGDFILSQQLISGSRTPEAKPKEDAAHVADQLFPVRIARIALHRSSFQFAQLLGESQDVRWRVTDIEGRILNLTPQPNTPDTFFTLQGTMLGSAMFKSAGTARRLEDPLAWKADVELKGFDLVAANPMLMRLLPLSFQSGHLDLYGEVRNQSGQLEGYLKPFFKKLQVINNQEHFTSFKHFAIEVVAAFANWVLRTHEDKVVATRIPFHREESGLKIDKGATLEGAIANGFGQPLNPGIEESLNLKDR